MNKKLPAVFLQRDLLQWFWENQWALSAISRIHSKSKKKVSVVEESSNKIANSTLLNLYREII